MIGNYQLGNLSSAIYNTMEARCIKKTPTLYLKKNNKKEILVISNLFPRNILDTKWRFINPAVCAEKMDENMSCWLALNCSGIPAALCVQAMCTAWITSNRESSSAAVLLSRTWEDCTSLVGLAWVQDRCLLVSNWPC